MLKLTTKTEEQVSKERRIGVMYSLSAYVLWGLLPLYWKLLKQIPPEEILAHRMLWSFVFVAGIMLFTSNWRNMKNILNNTRNVGLIFLSALIISLNWFTYIWAVNSNHVVEASMGYYINPLFAVFLGMTVFKERFNIMQCVALVLASLGVIIMTIQYGQIPWIALTLAITFGFYGLLKKLTNVDSITGLCLETAFLMPLALGFLIYKQGTGTGALGQISTLTTIILLGSGVATATPLLWFAQGARRVELSMMGFLQYIAPTISLLLGVLVFNEQFTPTHLISFGFIWLALAIYSLSKVGLFKNVELVYLKSKI